MRRPQLTGSSAGLRNRSGFDDNLKKPRICWDNHGALRVTTGPKTAGRTRNGWRYSAPDALPRTLPPPAFSPGAEGHRFESCGPRQFSRPFSSKTRVSATALADDGALAPAFEPDSPEPVRAGQNTAGGTTRSSSIDPPTTPPVSDRTIRPRRLGVFLAHARGRPHIALRPHRVPPPGIPPCRCMLRAAGCRPRRPPLTAVAKSSPDRSVTRDVAARWCRARGAAWTLRDQLGAGGTAPVFEVTSPDGARALKIYDEEFSSGQLREIEHNRIQQQLNLQNHDCPSLIQVYEGDVFEDRLYLLMSRAPGTELEQRLPDIPRSKIRGIVHHVARACLFLQSRDICHRDIKPANIFVSDDFEHATLLDISVIRGIHDPVGVGTDHDGQLPVLATARYSPPEYLFRLIEPGPDLWHALTIYQLGALLHDLIVRVPLFQAEYEQSKSNRYRFAWVVATQIPRIPASDVDDDLLFIAHRALDKDWARRSALRIEDFLHDSTVHQKHAFQLLGMLRDSVPRMHSDVQIHRMRLDQVATSLEDHLTGYLRKGGATPTHEVLPGPHGGQFSQYNPAMGRDGWPYINRHHNLRAQASPIDQRPWPAFSDSSGPLEAGGRPDEGGPP